jgi:hypothetical protein
MADISRVVFAGYSWAQPGQGIPGLTEKPLANHSVCTGKKKKADGSSDRENFQVLGLTVEGSIFE